MSKQLTIKVTDKQYDYFKRIATEDNRKLNDLVRLIFCTGCHFHWSESHFSIKKRDDEYTPEEQDQIVKNSKIEKKLEQEEKRVWNLTSEERKELGYVGVEDYYHGGGGYHDENNFNYVLAEQLRKPLIDQEEN